jgi:serine/threonine-protein kinase mTOR
MLDPGIRLTALFSLDPAFDHHLAHAEHIRTLFLCINDESFAVRLLATSILGRLACHNPAYVMPPLRRTLIQLLTELEYSGIKYLNPQHSYRSRQREESAQLITQLITNAHNFVKPYVESILKVLITKTRDPNTAVVTTVLVTIGELARIGGEELIPYIPKLMPIIMETLQDQSLPTKREASLRTLGLLASSTGWVIEPYTKYPTLLGILLGILQTELAPSIRKEATKTLGILGALDPYKYQVYISNL